MNWKYLWMAIAGGMMFLCECSPGSGREVVLVQVGGTCITQRDVDLFDALKRITPVKQDTLGLLNMDPIVGIVQTEAIYQKVHRNSQNNKFRSSKEWLWKENHFISWIYSLDILQKNCGFSDREVRNYYNTHKSEFLNNEDTVASTKDHGYFPFDSVRRDAARRLFLRSYTFDSTFFNMDLRSLRNFEYFRSEGYRYFFTKKYYNDKFRCAYTGTLEDFHGKNNLINDQDIHDAFFLLSPRERDAYKKDPLPFLQTLLQYKLFSDKAVSSGYLSGTVPRKFMEWAWKVEVAQHYINTKIAPLAKKNILLDSSMALYAFWDEEGACSVPVDSARLKKFFARIADWQMKATYDSLMHPLLRERHVVSFHNAWRDVKGGNPEELKKKADSLREAGNAADACSAYSNLAVNYVFTRQGRSALIELAKLQTENTGIAESRQEAIKNYRRFLLGCCDLEKRSEIMYQIGFIYDQYLDKPELAEINYRWVLKNALSGRQARDAEVMMLHLGEPLPDMERLREEALRQNRKNGR